jgi:hypothetical protein
MFCVFGKEIMMRKKGQNHFILVEIGHKAIFLLACIPSCQVLMKGDFGFQSTLAGGRYTQTKRQTGHDSYC